MWQCRLLFGSCTHSGSQGASHNPKACTICQCTLLGEISDNDAIAGTRVSVRVICTDRQWESAWGCVCSISADIHPLTIPFAQSFLSLLHSNHPTPTLVFLLCSAESIVLFQFSSYSVLLDSVSKLYLPLLMPMCRVFTVSHLINSELPWNKPDWSWKSSNNDWTVGLLSGILDQRQRKHCSSFRQCMEYQVLVSGAPCPGKLYGSISVLRVI